MTPQKTKNSNKGKVPQASKESDTTCPVASPSMKRKITPPEVETFRSSSGRRIDLPTDLKWATKRQLLETIGELRTKLDDARGEMEDDHWAEQYKWAQTELTAAWAEIQQLKGNPDHCVINDCGDSLLDKEGKRVPCLGHSFRCECIYGFMGGGEHTCG